MRGVRRERPQNRRLNMRIRVRQLAHVVIAATAGAMCLLANENISLTQPSSLVTQADARVGRPMTATSVAGVARRTTRRAVVGGAIVGGTVGYGYYGGPCRGWYPRASGPTLCPLPPMRAL